jgi:hypothetical protein
VHVEEELTEALTHPRCRSMPSVFSISPEHELQQTGETNALITRPR